MVVCAPVMAACQASDDPSVIDSEVITWPIGGGVVAGQLIVTIRNDLDHTVDPDVLGRGNQTVAHLVDGDGAELPGSEARIQLNAIPEVLAPGETGYLFADFEVADPAGGVADARIEVNGDGADAPTPVTVENFKLVENQAGLGASGRLEWDGSGSAVARAIAFDADGVALGYLSTSEVRYTSGPFTMCCFPPLVGVDMVDDVTVFGAQAIADD